jgi:hypothetical protein
MKAYGLLWCDICSLVDRFQRFGATYCLNLQGRSEHVCAAVTHCTHVIEAVSLGVGLVADCYGRHSFLCFQLCVNICQDSILK